MRFLLILIPFVLSACVEAHGGRIWAEGALQAPDPYHPPLTPVAGRTFEEWKEVAGEIPYDRLLGDAEALRDEIVYFEGQVLEVIATEHDTRFRVAVTYDEAWEDEILVRSRETDTNIARGDTVAFAGRVNGLINYVSVGLLDVTIPDITAYVLQTIENRGL